MDKVSQQASSTRRPDSLPAVSRQVSKARGALCDVKNLEKITAPIPHLDEQPDPRQERFHALRNLALAAAPATTYIRLYNNRATL